MVPAVPEYGPSEMHSGEPREGSSDTPSDGELVARARAGSQSAFETLVRRYQKPVYYLILRYVRDADDAADLAQRAFIRAFDKVTELRGDHVFRTWLFRIAVNLALNFLRDNARFIDDEAAGTGLMEAPIGASRLEAGEESAALRRAVAQLPTRQRMTLELRVYEELSFREIAEALDTTEGAAKVNFHYAVRKLRTLLVDGDRPGKVGKR